MSSFWPFFLWEESLCDLVALGFRATFLDFFFLFRDACRALSLSSDEDSLLSEEEAESEELLGDEEPLLSSEEEGS